MKVIRVIGLGVGVLAWLGLSAVMGYWVMDQTVTRTPAPPAEQSVPLPTPATELVISEWSVALPLTDTIRDARYYTSPTVGVDTITVTSKRATDLLGSVTGCRYGLYGTFIKRVPISQKATGQKVLLQTSMYRFEQVSPVEPVCQVVNAPVELMNILATLDTAATKMYEHAP